MEAKDNNGRLEIELPALLDLPLAAELRDVLLDALARDTGADLVLKADAVERVSTAAIQVLLAAQAAFAAAARRLEVEAASPALRAAFGHLGLTGDLDQMTTS